MSTRATYRFEPDSNGITAGTTFYIHHDGYPEGAAAYLYAMLDHGNTHGGLADRFHRANERAELTSSHYVHGDTDYRYTIYFCGGEANITSYKRIRGSGERDGWTVNADETLISFIQRHGHAIEGYRPLVCVKHVWRGDEWMTASHAERHINVAKLLLAGWEKNGVNQEEHNGNRRAVEEGMKLYQDALDASMQPA